MACCEGRFRFCFVNILLLWVLFGIGNTDGLGTKNKVSLKAEGSNHLLHIKEWTENGVEDAIKGGYPLLVMFFTSNDPFKGKELLQTISVFDEFGVKVFQVLEHSEINILLRGKYGLKLGPAVLYLDPSGKHKVFQDHQLGLKTLEIFLTAQLITVHFRNMTNFESEVLTVSDDYLPVVVCFYATWAEGSLSHLLHYKSTSSEFQSHGVKLRWGLVDISDERSAVGRVVNATFAVHVPFTILFHKAPSGNTVVQSSIALAPSVPSLWRTYSRFLDLSINVTVNSGEKLTADISAWGTIGKKAVHVDVCRPYEGPFGTSCHEVSHNLTDSEHTTFTSFSTKSQSHQLYNKQRKTKNFQVMSDDFGLRLFHGLPILTGNTWSDVIERSYLTNPLISSERLGKLEATRVSMVIYIMAGCGSCTNNMPVFSELRRAVAFMGSGDVYLLNCTDDADLCRREGITGFPTVTAYRGLDWLEGDHCSQELTEEKYIRMDYHGVIMVDPIMTWYQESTTATVTYLRFKPLPTVMEEDVWLVAMVMPTYSKYLPIPPGRDYGYYLPLTCFRLACERLYGQVQCYTIYSPDIPASEFVDTSQYIVKQIKMVRRDGVDLTLTQLGRPVLMTLHESESERDIHKFHTPHPHRYGLHSGFKCEDNHGLCIDVVVKYTRDHARLPVTRMTAQIFHTKNSLFSNKNIPVLVALAHPENITVDSEFYKTLTAVGYELYNDLILVTVDVTEYPNWVGQFVPKGFYTNDFDTNSRFMQYPRLCLVFWTNHHEAAFFPPTTTKGHTNNAFQVEDIVKFSRQFLQNPKKFMVSTEHF